MTISLKLTPTIEQAISEAAQQHGQTPEEEVTHVLESVFADAAPSAEQTLTRDARDAFTERHFAAAAEATRAVWDTPEEDAAWEFLQAPVLANRA